MDQDIKLSIVIPFYNGENQILRLLKSVDDSFLESNYNIQLEILIVIDSPNTKLGDLLELFNKCLRPEFVLFIKVYMNDVNVGVAESRNKGLLLSTGAYITFIDQDDSLDIQYFNYISSFMHKSLYDLCIINGYYHYLNTGKKVPLYFLKPRFNFKSFIIQNRILTPGLIIFKKNLLIRNDLFFADVNKLYKGCDDWFLYLNLVSKANFKFLFVNKRLYNYYFHDANYSNNIREAVLASLATLEYFCERSVGKGKKVCYQTLERLKFEFLLYADKIGLVRSVKREPLGFIFYLNSRLCNFNRIFGFIYRKFIRMPFRT